MILSGLGRLSKEPKMSFTPKGVAQTNLSVAIDVGYGDKKETVWASIWAYGAQAELVNQYLSKGSRLDFSAELTGLYTYTDKDGDPRASVNGKLLTVTFVDSGKGKKNSPTPYDRDMEDVIDDGDEPEEF